ncbi:MAG: DUF2752 domain-containing protein [Candidatus Zixiibacteriota bacterium]
MGTGLFKRAVNFVEPEAILWIAALGFLALINPAGDQHFTFCIFKNLGLDFCPGCGLGRSIAYLMQGEPGLSLNSHPLGIAVIAMIVVRIMTLLYRYGINFVHKSGGSYGRHVSITARDSGR